MIESGECSREIFLTDTGNFLSFREHPSVGL